MGLKILICDDHKIMLDGLKSIFKADKDFEEIFTCLNAEDALVLLEDNQIDVALIDINMPIMNGIELTEKIRLTYPYTKVIILTMNNSLGSIQQALEAGAVGYILKNTDKRELLEAIRRVTTKGKYFSKEVIEVLLSNDPIELDSKKDEIKSLELTPREMEVLKLIIGEYSNQQIADSLNISSYTVETHRKNLFRKTNTKSLVGLVKFAIESNLN